MQLRPLAEAGNSAERSLDGHPMHPDARETGGGRAADLRTILACVLLFLVAAAMANPSLEMGVNDDWSYTYMAKEYAATGHFAYSGWAAGALLPQVIWASLFIKLFGFSFLILRISTAILAALLIATLYYLGRESGLRPHFAAFGTLLGVVSPLVMPEALSFMSDVPACLLFILCLYGAVKAWNAQDSGACLGWLLLVLIAGLLAGLDRQIYWIAPLSYIPIIAWVHRRNAKIVRILALGWMLTVAIVALIIHWVYAEPYLLHESLWAAVRSARLAPMILHAFILVAKFALTVLLMLVPLLAGLAAPALRSLSRKASIFAVAGLLAAAVPVMRFHQLQAPFLGNVVTQYGVIPPEVLPFASPPSVLSPVVRAAITLAMLIGCASGAFLLWRFRTAALTQLCEERSPLPLLVLGSVFTAGWTAMVVFRGVGLLTVDRYVIFLPPLAAIALLWFHQRNIGGLSRLSWVTLALFSLYGVAAVHDAFSGARARLQAAQALEHSGIRRTQILAGLDYDGWTQLAAVGHVNNSQITDPPGTYRRLSCVGVQPSEVWYLELMTVLRPHYLVSPSLQVRFTDGPAPPVDYSVWLPPGRRQVFTYTLPEGYPECH